MSTKDNAVEAIEKVIEIHVESRNKLEQVIARKKFAGKDVGKERNKKAKISRKLGNLQDLLTELEAASTVVSAPTKDEIREVARHIKKIRDLAVKDAAVSAGFRIITSALTSASELRGKVRV